MVCIYNTANKYKYKMVSPAIVVVASRGPCHCDGGIASVVSAAPAVPAAAATIPAVVVVVVTPLPLPLW